MGNTQAPAPKVYLVRVRRLTKDNHGALVVNKKYRTLCDVKPGSVVEVTLPSHYEDGDLVNIRYTKNRVRRITVDKVVMEDNVCVAKVAIPTLYANVNVVEMIVNKPIAPGEYKMKFRFVDAQMAVAKVLE